MTTPTHKHGAPSETKPDSTIFTNGLMIQWTK